MDLEGDVGAIHTIVRMGNPFRPEVVWDHEDATISSIRPDNNYRRSNNRFAPDDDKCHVGLGGWKDRQIVVISGVLFGIDLFAIKRSNYIGFPQCDQAVVEIIRNTSFNNDILYEVAESMLIGKMEEIVFRMVLLP
jgi:hypothetical protein